MQARVLPATKTSTSNYKNELEIDKLKDHDHYTKSFNGHFKGKRNKSFEMKRMIMT